MTDTRHTIRKMTRWHPEEWKPIERFRKSQPKENGRHISEGEAVRRLCAAALALNGWELDLALRKLRP